MKLHKRILLPALLMTATLALYACGSGSSASSSQTSLAATDSNSSTSNTGTGNNTATGTARQIGHIFVIVLENKGYAQTFGPNSPAPYLARTLPAQGALVQNYYGIGHNSLTNYIALLSGQAPNPATQADCQLYTDFMAASTTLDANGQAQGIGCIYPEFVPTLANQLSAKGLAWKGYMEDMGNDGATREEATCGVPATNPLGQDATQSATATDAYAARHNPFVYFKAILKDKPTCQKNVVNLKAMSADLLNVSTTANYNFITPNLCNDAHDATASATTSVGPLSLPNPNASKCKLGGLEAADAFLKQWVPVITGSPAFQKDGLLMVIFDEADFTSASAPTENASACCGTSPNSTAGIYGPGGGRTGAVFLSPFIKGGTLTAQPYNHYSLLRSVEDMFGLDHLGYAAQNGLTPFGVDIFNN